jgi:hypothetical protein
MKKTISSLPWLCWIPMMLLWSIVSAQEVNPSMTKPPIIEMPDLKLYPSEIRHQYPSNATDEHERQRLKKERRKRNWKTAGKVLLGVASVGGLVAIVIIKNVRRAKSK